MKRLLSAISLILMASVLSVPANAYTRPGSFERINNGAGGAEASRTKGLGLQDCVGELGPPSISADGRFVAFASMDSNLTESDHTPMFPDVFVYDRRKGTTELASVSSTGSQGTDVLRQILGAGDTCPGGSQFPSISDNGRFVAFSSYADLVSDDTNQDVDVFVHDMRSGKTVRVNESAGGEQSCYSDSGCEPGSTKDTFVEGSISGDGRYVVFGSEATNLVPQDQKGDGDIFLRDLQRDEIVRISEGVNPNGVSTERPSIDRDGRFILFNGGNGLWVHDMKSGENDLVNPNFNGDPAGGQLSSSGEGISADGRFVVFESTSTALVPNSRNLMQDGYVYDRREQRVERISVSPSGELGDEDLLLGGRAADEISISANGRYVVYSDTRSNMSPERDRGPCDVLIPLGPKCVDGDLFIHDRYTGANERISLDPKGGETICGPGRAISDSTAGDWNFIPCGARWPVLSGDGREALFWSDFDGYVEGDKNLSTDLFLLDRGKTVGVGGSGASVPEDQSEDDQICVTPDACIPPGAFLYTSDDETDVSPDLVTGGADLTAASVAYRPQYRDLFLAIELARMPSLHLGVGPVSTAGLPAILYGFRFGVADRSYEVRASSLKGGTFGLFDCTAQPVCTKVRDLSGGYGTTGERVVFSLPLSEVGLDGGGALADVEAFSEVGSGPAGSARTLDRVKL